MLDNYMVMAYICKMRINNAIGQISAFLIFTSTI